MIEIKHKTTGEVLYRSEKHTVLEALAEWLELPTESRPSLRGANLSWSDLRGVDLSGVDLRGANIRGANIRGAVFSGADLRGANLSFADLRGANLRWADLAQTGCLTMQCGPWHVWITPDDMAIGCKSFTHDLWRNATDAEIAAMESRAAEFWSHWKTMLLAACEACAKHGWPAKEPTNAT